MTTTINGSSPSITFSDSTTQASAGLPLSGGNLSGSIAFTASNAGITFANSSALTNSQLNDYETGTFTPTASPSTGTITTYTSSGIYTKIGNLVFVVISIGITTAGTAGGSLQFGNLPFYVSNYTTLCPTNIVREYAVTGLAYQAQLISNQGGSIWSMTNGAVVWGNSYQYRFSMVYQATF
jgi:hypothetical protein